MRLLNRTVRFYVVQRGDTLSEIGLRLGLSWRWLARLNRLRDPNVIHPGQLIQLED
ncbi:MAG: LysM domain-containing protein [Hyphomicrobium sp.]|jgi:nucleoid-associated protein YgaU